MRAEHKKLVSQGINPNMQKKAKLSASLGDTFAAVASDWFDRKVSTTSKANQKRARGYLNNYLIPKFGNLPIASIATSMLLACLREVEAKENNQGKKLGETPHRLRSTMSRIWRYAVTLGKAEHDIATPLIGSLTPHKPKNFSHITDEKKLGDVLAAIDGYSGEPETATALKLLPLFFVRPGELRAAKWEEFDLEERTWRFHSGKVGIDHIVPLSTQAVALLRQLKSTQTPQTYAFQIKGKKNYLSANTFNSALKRLGFPSEEIQPHGFRHTAATLLAERGYNTAHIEIQLSHVVQGVPGKYQKAKYLDPRITLMQEWSDIADDLKAKAREAAINKQAEMEAVQTTHQG